jgi:hypothetical protein
MFIEAKPMQYAMIMEAKPTQYAMIMEAKPTQYAMIMEAKPTQYAMSDGGDPDTDGGDHGDDVRSLRTLAWGGPAADAGWTPCSLISTTLISSPDRQNEATCASPIDQFTWSPN